MTGEQPGQNPVDLAERKLRDTLSGELKPNEILHAFNRFSEAVDASDLSEEAKLRKLEREAEIARSNISIRGKNEAERVPAVYFAGLVRGYRAGLSAMERMRQNRFQNR